MGIKNLTSSVFKLIFQLSKHHIYNKFMSGGYDLGSIEECSGRVINTSTYELQDFQQILYGLKDEEVD